MNQTINLLKNLDKTHTTEMGRDRIRKNLGLDMDDPVEYCKAQLINQVARIYQEGKNWY